MNTGWACPCCGKVNAPFVQQCNCAGYGAQPLTPYYPTIYPFVPAPLNLPYVPPFTVTCFNVEH